MNTVKELAANALRPEEQALVLFARQDLDGDDISLLKELFTGAFDFEYFSDTANKQGIAPVIGYHLINNPVLREEFKKVSPETLRPLVLLYELTCIHNRQMYADLEKVNKLFSTHGIKFVVLKGPVLAKTVYSDYGMRIFGDLDLLIAPEDMLKAHTVLKNDGFAAYNFHGEMMSEEQIITRMQSDYHLYPYIKGTMNIELHQYDGEYEIDLKSVYHDAGKTQLNNAVFFVPNEIDLFIYACAHFVQHRKQANFAVLQGLIIGNNMRQLMDIREIYLYLKGREAEIRARIEALACRDIVLEALAITEKFYGKFSDLYPDSEFPADLHYWYAENWDSHFERRFFSGEEERMKIINKSREYAAGKQVYYCVHREDIVQNETHPIPSVYSQPRYLKFLLGETENAFPIHTLDPCFTMSWDDDSFYTTIQLTGDAVSEERIRGLAFQLLFGFQSELPQVIFVKPVESGSFGDYSVYLWQENYEARRQVRVAVEPSLEQNMFRISLIVPWHVLNYDPPTPNEELFFDVTIRTAKESMYHEEHMVSWSTGKYYTCPWVDHCDKSIMNVIRFV